MINITTNPRPAHEQDLTWQEARELGLDACPPEYQDDEDSEEAPQ